MQTITRPQERLLWNAMKSPVSNYGPNARVICNLLAKGLIEESPDRRGMHFQLYQPTRSGLDALLYWHAMRDSRSGCIAYMQSRAEVEQALAARFPEPMKLAA
jgi:hypothetical protein